MIYILKIQRMQRIIYRITTNLSVKSINIFRLTLTTPILTLILTLILVQAISIPLTSLVYEFVIS